MSDSSAPRGPAAVLGVSTRAFDLVRALIEQQLGLDFSGAREGLLESKLVDLIASRGVRSHLDLYYLLRYDSDRDALWAEVADHLSVPETFFWRQPEQIAALAGELVPNLIASGCTPRIWSAACCSGEEPLTFAIALHAAGIPLDSVELIGSDASPRALDRARAGFYGERSLRRLPYDLRRRYFTAVEGGWRIDPEVHAAVSWQRANLLDPNELRPLAHADVVFCRNVFIYFSDTAVRQVIGTLEKLMPDHGTLVLGAAESLARVPTRFELREVLGAFVYQKSDAEETRSTAPVAPMSRLLAG